MAKLFFYYSSMNAGKTTILLQSAHNYRERGMTPLLFTPKLDDRYGAGVIGLYHNPFGWSVPFFKKTSLYIKTDYINSDANIDFYDTEIFSAGAGLFFRF